MAKRRETQATEKMLKGWAEIAAYLGQPVSTVHRWANAGMPVDRSGRYVVSDQQEQDRWLGHELGLKQPTHIVHAGDDDLAADLRKAVRAVRGRKSAA